MPNTFNSRSGPGQAGIYVIRIKGHLGPHWDDWFERMSITPEANGNTVLTGPIADQSELHGMLRKIQDLGIPLISFMRLDAIHDDVVDDRDQRHETESGR